MTTDQEGVKLLRMAAGEWPRPGAAVCSAIETPPRRILREHLDSPTGRAWGDMLRAHAEWLNGWHTALDETDGDGQLVRVGLDDYWDVLAGPADDPHVVMDVVHEEERRIVVLRCSPYHDEGGPCTLTGHFELDDGMRWVGLGDGGEGLRPVEPPRWLLRAMVMEHDTIHDLIVREGKVEEPK